MVMAFYAIPVTMPFVTVMVLPSVVVKLPLIPCPSSRCSRIIIKFSYKRISACIGSALTGISGIRLATLVAGVNNNPEADNVISPIVVSTTPCGPELLFAKSVMSPIEVFNEPTIGKLAVLARVIFPIDCDNSPKIVRLITALKVIGSIVELNCPTIAKVPAAESVIVPIEEDKLPIMRFTVHN